jgi:hypothetical protein
VLEDVKDHFKCDKNIVLVAAWKCSLAFQYAHEDLQNNEEVVLALVQENGSALEYVKDVFKRNRNIVLAAVRENGCALKHASEDLQIDEEVVAAANNELNGASQETANPIPVPEIVENPPIILSSEYDPTKPYYQTVDPYDSWYENYP